MQLPLGIRLAFKGYQLPRWGIPVGARAAFAQYPPVIIWAWVCAFCDGLQKRLQEELKKEQAEQAGQAQVLVDAFSSYAKREAERVENIGRMNRQCVEDLYRKHQLEISDLRHSMKA